MSTKFQEYYQRMIEVEKQLFDKFQLIHDKYTLEPEKYQNEFNSEGERVLQIIQLWEGKLCKQSEVGGYSFSTPALAEKFRAEVRKHFPEIDNIGIIIDSSAKNPKNDSFLIKKIIL